MEENIKVYSLGGKKVVDIKSDITGNRYLRIEYDSRYISDLNSDRNNEEEEHHK